VIYLSSLLQCMHSDVVLLIIDALAGTCLSSSFTSTHYIRTISSLKAQMKTIASNSCILPSHDGDKLSPPQQDNNESRTLCSHHCKQWRRILRWWLTEFISFYLYALIVVYYYSLVKFANWDAYRVSLERLLDGILSTTTI
jgi:hypothetical protein